MHESLICNFWTKFEQKSHRGGKKSASYKQIDHKKWDYPIYKLLPLKPADQSITALQYQIIAETFDIKE